MNSKKLPNKLKICGKTYNIKYVKQQPYRNIKYLGRRKVVASHDYEASIITIWYQPDMSNDYILEKLIHESLHAIEHGIKIEIGEIPVKCFAPMIQALFKDNKKLRNMLDEKDK